jgi:hypothetical protein
MAVVATGRQCLQPEGTRELLDLHRTAAVEAIDGNAAGSIGSRYADDGLVNCRTEQASR